jgi:hypothetical protein
MYQPQSSGISPSAPAGSRFRTAQRNALPGWVAAGAPVVIAVRRGTSLVITCPYCGEEHRHGACLHRGPCLPFDGICLCPPGTGNGHRIEHCRVRPSDRLLPGYVLREVAA